MACPEDENTEREIVSWDEKRENTIDNECPIGLINEISPVLFR